MKSKGLLERKRQPYWRSHLVLGAGGVFLWIGLCFLLTPSHADGGKLEDRNKAVARAAFFDYLNHRDFKRFEEIHTKDFVKHYNNSPAENLSEEMGDAKGQFDSSSDLTFTENWMIAEGEKETRSRCALPPKERMTELFRAFLQRASSMNSLA